MDTEILKDNFVIIFLFSVAPVMVEKDVYTAYITTRPGTAHLIMPGCNVMYAGLDHGRDWGGGEGMPSGPASDVTTQEREEAMRGRCNKYTGRLRLSK